MTRVAGATRMAAVGVYQIGADETDDKVLDLPGIIADEINARLGMGMVEAEEVEAYGWTRIGEAYVVKTPALHRREIVDPCYTWAGAERRRARLARTLRRLRRDVISGRLPASEAVEIIQSCEGVGYLKERLAA